MVIANHQSWVDILVLQRILIKNPLPEVFPQERTDLGTFSRSGLVGAGFPLHAAIFAQVAGKEAASEGKDIETTRQACAKFRHIPVSVMNFVEGTRFTARKHDKQAAPYRHLLHPRAGGIAFTLAAMGDQLHKLVDVTIAYPDGIPSYWDFMCGRVKEIKVRVRFCRSNAIWWGLLQ